MIDQIKQAIERSISHNEIVSVTIDGDYDAALTAIESITETDHVLGVRTLDYAVDGETLDVWAAEIDAPDGEMLWRLAITCE